MIHFLINGFPFCFSDTATPLSGATATLKPWIVGGADLVRAIRHQIEPWGGVVTSPEIQVTLADADMALSRMLPIYPDPAPVRCLEYMITPVISGAVLVDVSDNSDLSVGDVLQCPYDAWEITAVGPAELPTGITCDRGIYSCFPGSTWIYQPYYQRGSLQNELFSFGRDGKIPELDGRTCTLWIDGELAWIGVISAPTQHGPRWTFRCRHILDAWRDGLAADALPAFHLNHDVYNGGGQWWQGNLAPGDSSGGLPVVGAIPAPYYPQDYGWTTDDRRGLSYLGTGEPTMAQTLQNRATLAALGASVAYASDIGRYVTQPGGTRKYGWIDDPAMPVGVLGALNADLVGQWVDCPDGLTETVRKQIAAVSTANGTITLDQMTYDKDGQWVPGRAGFSSSGPISWRAAPVVSAPSIPILIYGLLTSTGSGDNGDHDLYPGYLGLGLPAELLDDRISYLLHATPVDGADFGEAKLSDELQAAGCWLVWRGGQFAIQEVAAPTTQAADETLDGNLISTGAAPEVDRAAIAPVLTVTYEDSAGDRMTINVRTPQIFRPTAGASKALSSKLRSGLPDPDLSGALASISFWLSRYAPAVRVGLIPGHGLVLGQVVTLDCPFLAGAGDAYGASVAALVTGVSAVEAELLLNTQPSPERILAPALRVLKWTGAVLTVAGGALQWLSLAGLDDDLALHDETTGEIQVVTLVSIDADDQVTISATPTHDAGDAVILTLMTYDADLAANHDRYCYLADTVSEQLDGDDPHEYVF